jgi:hypothetical protein
MTTTKRYSAQLPEEGWGEWSRSETTEDAALRLAKQLASAPEGDARIQEVVGKLGQSVQLGPEGAESCIIWVPDSASGRLGAIGATSLMVSEEPLPAAEEWLNEARSIEDLPKDALIGDAEQEVLVKQLPDGTDAAGVLESFTWISPEDPDMTQRVMLAVFTEDPSWIAVLQLESQAVDFSGETKDGMVAAAKQWWETWHPVDPS